MVTFGGYDLESYAKGPINWHYINQYSHYWELELKKMEYDLTYKNETTNTFDFSSKPLIVDSGTSFFLMPKNDLLVFLA